MAVSPGLLAILKDHQTAQEKQQRQAADLWQNHDLVFCQEDGSPFYPDGISKRFKRILRAAGLPQTTTLHDLRHYGFGSVMRSPGSASSCTELVVINPVT